MKIVTVDVGNSKIKTGEFYNSELIRTMVIDDPLEIKPFIYGKRIEVVISSVVPKTTSLLETILRNQSNTDVFLLNHSLDFGFSINYEPLQSLGLDRLSSVAGAKHLLEVESELHDYDYVIAFDFGTATTVNILQVGKQSIFRGGMITPGLRIMNAALNNYTAKLPMLENYNIGSFIGNTTENSIRAGIINSSIGLVERTYDHFTGIADEVKVFMTGGYAPDVIPNLHIPFQHEPFLNLIGIYSVYSRNKR
ncbi:MAG: type III pantothenate kinase [Ignavibacteriaceae bacterium]|nr:MAG: type III pantothenate kinase [Ignavibacteriaceae bacterium]